MKRILFLAATCLLAVCAKAQKIEVVDSDGKGRMKFIIETYVTEHAYIDDKEFKAKKKDLKSTYVEKMKLDDLEAYATSHGIPALAPTLKKAIEGLNKK